MRLVGFAKIDQMYPENSLTCVKFRWGVSSEKRSCRLHGCKILRSKILVGWSTFGEEIEKEYPPPKIFCEENQDFKISK